MANFTLIKKILLALNNKLAVRGLFFVLAKAFDCVNHEVLIAKLEFYGISNMSGKLIMSYLTDRYQRYLINSNYVKNIFEWQNVNNVYHKVQYLGLRFFFYTLMNCRF
jgi:hypothetical protein